MVLFNAFSFIKRRRGAQWKQDMQSLLSHFSFPLQTQYKCFSLIFCIVLSSIVLSSCSGLSFGTNANPTAKVPTPTPTALALAKLHWCDKPLMLFRDLAASGTPGVSAGKPTSITDWVQVKAKLGFTVYLPAMLPTGSCLVSASGTVRDPILGSNFVIGYVLPDHSSITLSQAPQRSQSAAFQCTQSSEAGTTKAATPTATTSATQAPTQFCSGARGSTNIVFSSRGKTDALQQFFNTLQPDIEWVPAA